MTTIAEPSTANAPMGPKGHRLPAGRAVQYNPSPEELQRLTALMPQARRTGFGNYNVQTRVVSR
ncbi:MAG: hypothetical protein ABIQ05_07845, partial [Candidatus Limnocylindria bacterium]